MNINLDKLEQERKRNFAERLKFVRYWAEYVKSHSDEDWSEQQNIVINSQMN